MTRAWFGAALVFLPFVWGACSDGDSATSSYDPGGGGSGGDTAAPDGKSVGEACTDSEECRAGLTCDDGTCQPSHATKSGQPCTISAECETELYCASGACAPAGSGADGEDCATDGNCASGLRCVLEGFSASCKPEGSVDLGGACVLSGECYGGLACVEGSCSIVPPGVPPFGLPWQGVACDPPVSDNVEALFMVPRGGGNDKDFFSLPYPNDVRKTGTTLDLSGFPVPGSSLLGYDPVQRYVDATEAGSDGWGMYSSALMRFTGGLDIPSLTDRVKLVNLTDGQVLGLRYSYSSGGNNYICHHRMAIRPSQGRAFEPGKTYGAYLLSGIKGSDGVVIPQPADLAALVGASAPSDSALAPHYDKYAPLRSYLSANTIATSSILNAAVFTVGNPRSAVEKLPGVIAAAPAPTASKWTLCDSSVISPCPDAAATRACDAADPDFHELHALVTLPIFQQGSAPYLDPADGGDLKLNGGVPEVVRSEEVCMSLSVPKGGGAFGTVIYAHGTGGDFRSHIRSGLAKEFAKGVGTGTGAVVKAAVLGIDQVQHGPRAGGSTKSPNDLFFNFANPKAARGNPQQGAADQMALLRFVPTVSLDNALTGDAFNLTSNVALWGHSQGATQGAIALPYGSWAGVFFSGQGASLKDALVTKTSPVNIAGVLPFVLSDPDSEGKLAHGIDHPVLNLLQHYIDGADPIAYGRIAVNGHAGNADGHHVFQAYGQSDSYTPSAVQATYALDATLSLAAHDASVTTPDKIGGLTPVVTPLAGNRTVNGAPITAAVRQYAQSGSADGHFVAFDVASAHADALRFLAGALGGITPRVGQ